MILATLLKELGDVAKGEGEKERAAGFYLKGFDLLLGLLNRGDIYDTPRILANVETFLSSLSDRKLPLGLPLPKLIGTSSGRKILGKRKMCCLRLRRMRRWSWWS